MNLAFLKRWFVLMGIAISFGSSGFIFAGEVLVPVIPKKMTTSTKKTLIPETPATTPTAPKTKKVSTLEVTPASKSAPVQLKTPQKKSILPEEITVPEVKLTPAEKRPLPVTTLTPAPADPAETPTPISKRPTPAPKKAPTEKPTPAPTPEKSPAATPEVTPAPTPETKEKVAPAVSPEPEVQPASETPTPIPTQPSPEPKKAPIEKPTPAPTPTPEEQPKTTPEVEVTPKPTPATQASMEPSETSPQSLPKPVTTSAPEKKEMKPLPPKAGIDTVDIEEGGNWLLKRKALEDTADIIEKIINNFSKILEASTSYKIKRNKLDNDYDLYIATVGFNLGDLDQVLSNIVEELEKERKEDGDLTVDEREAMATINEKKNEIKQLQEDLKALTVLDQEIDKAVDTVDSQIKTANNYQNQAWKNFQEIKKVLSDEKAEELYYRTVSLQKSMQDIYNYLTGSLSTYFSNQIDTMRSKMDTIKSKIQSLQAKGVDLQKRMAEFEKEDEQREEEQRKEEQQEELEKALAQEKLKREKITWWQTIKSIIAWPFVQVKNVVNYFINLITSPFKAKPKKEPSPTQESSAEPVSPTEPKEKKKAKEA